MKHIVCILDNYWPHVGGHETLFRGLTHHLVLEGYRVTVITSRSAGSPKKEVDQGVEIIRHRGGRYFFGVVGCFHILRTVRSSDLVHTSSLVSGLWGWIFATIFRKKKVLTIHEVIGKYWMRFFGIRGIGGWCMERLLLSLPFDQRICVSQSTYKQLADPVTSCVIVNGFDSAGWDPRHIDTQSIDDDIVRLGIQDKHILLYFGRDGETKGVRFFLNAMQVFLPKHPNYTCVLLLPGSSLKKYASFVRRNPRIIVLPHQSQDVLKSWIVRADTVVIPSLLEGFGYSALQASHLHAHIVCSDAGALPDVASGNVTFFQRGSREDLLRALDDRIHNRISRTPKKTFPIHVMTEAYVQVYKDLIG